MPSRTKLRFLIPELASKAEVLGARTASSGEKWVRRFGYLCIMLSRDRPPVYPLLPTPIPPSPPPPLLALAPGLLPPQAYQCKITPPTSMETQMQLEGFLGGKSHRPSRLEKCHNIPYSMLSSIRTLQFNIAITFLC